MRCKYGIRAKGYRGHQTARGREACCMHTCKHTQSQEVHGIVIFYRNTLGYKPILLGPNDLELSIVSIHNGNCRLCIALFYRPPSSPVSTFDNFCTINFYNHWTQHCFLILYSLETLILTFITPTIHCTPDSIV